MSSSGIHFLKSIEWDPRSNQLQPFIVVTDTSSTGLAFFLPSLKLTYQCPILLAITSQHIFFKALAICSVFHQFVNILWNLDHHRLVIYSDSTNSVDIFNYLWAINPYNCILISAVNVVLDHDIDFWVLHIHGVDNPIADALSCFNNNLAVSLCPGSVIQTFKPLKMRWGPLPNNADPLYLQAALMICLDSWASRLWALNLTWNIDQCIYSLVLHFGCYEPYCRRSTGGRSVEGNSTKGSYQVQSELELELEMKSECDNCQETIRLQLMCCTP